MWLARMSGLFVVAMLIGISACSTVPVGNRPRIVDVPLAAVQSDIEFSIVSVLRANSTCTEDLVCESDAGLADSLPFGLEAGQIAGALQKAALKLYPDRAWCTPKPSGGCFDVYIVEGEEPGSSSSANGRIALNEGLGRWGAHDGVLAFVIAREMGHVIARHHEERSSVSIVASALLNFLIPGSGVLKSLLSTGGARFAAESNRNVQAMEADSIAFHLLKGSGFHLRNISKSLVATPVSVDEGGWSKDFSRSAKRLIAEAGTSEPTVASVRNGKTVDRREFSVDLAR